MTSNNPHLLISVRFLGDRYHGRTDDGRAAEWPPSPFRLFQALLAAAKARWSDPVADAFRWLESRPAPVVIAPSFAQPGRPSKVFVPNNNTDDAGNMRTEKWQRPTLLGDDRLVEYAWPVADADRPHAGAMADVVRRLRTLGWGIDMVVGHGAMVPAAPEASPCRLAHRPAAVGRPLRVPAPGSLASLGARHAADLNRFAAGGGSLVLDATPPTFATVRYATTDPRPACAFRFVTPDDDPVAYRVSDLKVLAGQLRHVAAAAARTFADDATVAGLIEGHPADGPRVSILPLPSIGHPHSDGLVRRVIFAGPPGTEGAFVAALGRALASKMLAFEGHCPCPGSTLDRLAPDDRVVQRFTTEARTWATVTPVLLPGHNERRAHKGDAARGDARALQLVCKALAQAAVQTPATIEISRVPYWAGTGHARNGYDPKGKLAHYPRFHVRLAFARPVVGPLSIGVGRHVGFGTLAACDPE